MAGVRGFRGTRRRDRERYHMKLALLRDVGNREQGAVRIAGLYNFEAGGRSGSSAWREN